VETQDDLKLKRRMEEVERQPKSTADVEGSQVKAWLIGQGSADQTS
jgi:hypothetical protein